MTVDPANQAPRAVGSIPGREMGVGQYAAIEVSSYFADPDGDSLVYAAESSDAAVGLASVSGTIIVISGAASGSVTVTVTARDPGGSRRRRPWERRSRKGEPHTAGQSGDPRPGVPGGGGYTGRSVIVLLGPDGDSLTYSARLANGDAARISVSGGELTISGVVLGTVTTR